jgi:hypothetical protein
VWRNFLCAKGTSRSHRVRPECMGTKRIGFAVRVFEHDEAACIVVIASRFSLAERGASPAHEYGFLTSMSGYGS